MCECPNYTENPSTPVKVLACCDREEGASLFLQTASFLAVTICYRLAASSKKKNTFSSTGCA